MVGRRPSRDAFKYDVFVSYAHVDDFRTPRQDKGWIRRLVDQIELRLFLSLGRRPRVYFDVQMALGANVSKQLLNTIVASRTMLVFASPNYDRSRWCDIELRKFMERGDTANESVFVAEAEYIDREQWSPIRAAGLKTIELWERDSKTGKAHRLDYRFAGQRNRLLERMYEIAGSIQERMSGDLIQTPAVWIAEPTDDLLDELTKLTKVIKQAGWRVLRTRVSHDENVYNESLQLHLREAKLFVQLFGPLPGRSPDWGGPEFSLLQADAARTCSEELNVDCLRWRKKGSVAAAERGSAYSSLLTEEMQEGKFAEFKSRVVKTLDALSRAVPRKEEPAANEAPLFIDIRSGADDLSLAEDILESLSKLGVGATISHPPDSEQSPGMVRSEERVRLDGCDGVILIYGTTPVEWVQAQFRLLLKAFYAVRPNGPIGILKAPPPPPKLAELRITPYKVLHMLDCTKGIKRAVLANFVKRVRIEAGQSPPDA